MRIGSKSKKSRSGQSILLFSLMVTTIMIPMVGLAIDGGRGYLVKLKLSSAVDGAALAAARLLGTGADAAAQVDNATATVKLFAHANFPANFFGANLVGEPTICVDPGATDTDPCKVNNGKSGVTTFKVRTVVVSATAKMPTLFMGLVGFPMVTVGANGVAARRDVRVVLVMDRSSSMVPWYTGVGMTPPSIQDIALKFVNSFSGSTKTGRDELGLVVYGGSAIVAYPPRDIAVDYTDYKKFTAPDKDFAVGTNMPRYIADIQGGSNTGTAEALYLAYMTLRADADSNPDLSTKLNVIVLFTDGLPNGVTAFANDPTQGKNYMMTTDSLCTNLGKGSVWTTAPLVKSSNNNMIGWFSQTNSFKVDTNYANGLYPPMMAYPASGFTGKKDDIDAYMKNGSGDNGAQIPQMVQTSDCDTPMKVTKTTTKNGKTTSTTTSTMAQFPDHDLYGNYTDLKKVPAMPTGPNGSDLYKLGDLYKNTGQCNLNGYDATATEVSCQIGLASWQAAAHQAWKIWNQIIWDKTAQANIADPGTNLGSPNLSNPIIFTIGFDHSAGGGEAPDMALLRMIANDPNSPVSFATRIKGQAFYAATPNAVDMAFQQISSQILRLSQ